MLIPKLQADINGLQDMVQKDIELIKQRQTDLEKLSTAADNLHDQSRLFQRVSEENKWRLWWKNNFKSIQLAFILFGIIILFLLLAGFIKILL